MDKVTATGLLVDLVDKYITDKTKKYELKNLLNSGSFDRPPVRGVLDDIYKYSSKPIEASDREDIDDLMYYFG